MGSLRQFDPGTKALFAGRACEIVKVVGSSELLVILKDTGESKVLNLDELDSPTEAKPIYAMHLDALSEKNSKKARRRLAAIKPLLGGQPSKNDLQKQADTFGVTVRTLYNWRRAYLDSSRLSGLAPKTNKRRARRLSKKIEAIIKDAIETDYLTAQKKSQQKVIERVHRKCKAAKLTAPHANTIRKRISDISEKIKTKSRLGSKKARDQYSEIRGPYDDAKYPLAIVQIDHTPLDIILVDDKYREPIGRPWLTLAMDVYSRMITGYYLSLDHPSQFSVGMCIQHSVLKKTHELAELGLDLNWDVWGIMQILHTDNGADFRGGTIEDACQEYGISQARRPVQTPHWGGHIERLLGSVSEEIHALPGTTFSNVQQRGTYKSEKTAHMTISELRKWFVHWISGVYHQRIHSQIHTTPAAMWERGIIGDGKDRKGIGLPPLPADPERLHLDFLPFVERTVRREGIVWDHIFYYSDDIKRWIRARKGSSAVKFRIRRDPRDLSRIYFLDPELGQYIEVPYRDISKPSVTIWEWRAAKAKVKADGGKHYNEEIIFDTRAKMDQISEDGITATKTTRRAEQKKREAKKGIKDHKSKLASAQKGPEARLTVVVDNVKESDESEEYFDIDEDEIKTGWNE